MSISYTKPTWVNDEETAINAARLQAISDVCDALVNVTGTKAVASINFDSSGQTATITFVDGTIATVENAMKGQKGDKGDKGDTGDQGPQGLTGPQGEQGPQGIQGEKGDKGDTGNQGEQGIQGIQGEQGIQGIQGEKGDKGDQGEQGIQGVQGIQGEKGDKGDTGEAGFSPIITEEASGNGYLVTITTATGTESIYLQNGEGVSDYTLLNNLPSINGNTITGEMTTEDLGISGGMSSYTISEWEELDHSEIEDGSQIIISDLKYIGIYDAENDTLTPVSNQPLEYTLEDWEGIYHDDIADGTQIIITDDYSSTICSTISECEASESVDDVAGASALNELYGKGLKLLWTNPNPASSFNAQNVTLASEDYDYLIFITRLSTGNADIASSLMVLKGMSARMTCGTAGGNGAQIEVRNANYVDNKTYAFTLASRSYGTSAATTNNTILIPIKIYGGKF